MSGKLDCFKTAGGHWRVLLDGIEAILRGDTDPKIARSSVSSPIAQQKREHIEELKLTLEEKKTKLALGQLEDQERETAERKEAAQRAKEDEALRDRREREAREQQRLEEQRKREELERWWIWVDDQVQLALKSLPPDIAAPLAAEIQLGVEDALQGVGPNRPKPIVQGLISGAIARVVQPWMRERQRKQDIAKAVSEVMWVRGLLGNRRRQARAQQAASKAILELPENATFDQMAIASRAAAERVVQEEEDREDREFAQKKREGEIDGYLGDVLTYLMELERATDHRGVDFEGETFQYAQKIKAAIKPTLLQDSSLNYFTAKQRVRQLVDDWIENSLNEKRV
jgi:hypothetical protein